MLESTIRRYKIIRKEVYKRLGKMPTMMAYAEVGVEMGLTEETIRKTVTFCILSILSGAFFCVSQKKSLTLQPL